VISLSGLGVDIVEEVLGPLISNRRDKTVEVVVNQYLFQDQYKY
jgi:hypothetical protein